MSNAGLLRSAGALVWVILLVGLVSFFVHQGARLKVETNILKLLPKSEADPILETAFENYASANMQKLVFLVESNTAATSALAARQLLKMLENSPVVESISTTVDGEKQQAISQFIFKYRHQLLSDKDRQILFQQEFEELAADAIETVYSPLSGGLAGLVVKDPFLLSYRFAQSLDSHSKLELSDGLLVAQQLQKHYVFIAASLSSSPFEQTTQQSLQSQLSQVQADWQLSGLDVQLLKTGALFYASHAYKTAAQEISTIGLTSLLLVIALVLISFRSILPLLLTSLALLMGIASGLMVILLLFGKIHLITLVFGASLIGVAVDYAFHFFVIENSLQGSARVKRILPAISLGLVSSIVGYLGLLSTPFPGLRQMAMFCITGLIVAYLTVICFFPLFKLKRDTANFMRQGARKILARVERVSVLKLWRWLWIFPIIACVIVINQPIMDDNIRQFQTTDPQLKAHENKIKSVLNLAANNQFFLVDGESQQALLENMEKIQPALQQLVEHGVIDGFENISVRLPSHKKQSENYALIASLYRSSAFQPLIDLGVVNPQQYAQAVEQFERQQQQHLSAQEWLGSELGKPFDGLLLGRIEQRYAAIIPIQGINDLTALKDLNSNAVFVDKVGKITEVFSDYRKLTSKLLLLALLLISIILSWRYGMRKSIIIVSSPIFSLSLTVIFLFFLNVNLTLFNTLALFLIIGIGIDYGLFFAESKRFCERTFLAIFLSALTTVFSFGLLALSQTIAIQAFGLTMLIGITSSFLLSPLVGSLVINRQE